MGDLFLKLCLLVFMVSGKLALGGLGYYRDLPTNSVITYSISNLLDMYMCLWYAQDNIVGLGSVSFFIHNKLFTYCWIRIHSILSCTNWFIKSVGWYNYTVSCYTVYDKLNYARILTGSHLWSIGGQTHRWQQCSIQVWQLIL